LPVTVSVASGGSTYWQIFGPVSSVFIWGFQLEAGSFPTSYIPTTTATVTRAADVASITGANFSSWFNTNQGTFFLDWRVPFAAAAGNQRVLNFGTNSFNAAIVSGEGVMGGINPYFSPITRSPASLATSGARVATATSIGESAGTSNGDVAVATGACSYYNSATSLNFVPAEATSIRINYIKRIIYWPARLYNEALQYITQSPITIINLYAFNYAINGKDVLALNAVRNASTRNFIFIKGLLSAAQPRLTAAAASTSSALTLATNALPKLSPTSSGNYFFASGITLSGVTTRINGTNALSIATSPFSGSTATAPLLFRELRPQANWRFTEPMPSGTIASPEFAIPFETNDFVLFMKAGPN
jgi:hypothetical protein